jgi:hypothetical protein
MRWDAIKIKLAKAAQGMANLRDGGLFIIGRAKSAERPEGMDVEHLQGYDVDLIRDFVDSYASPPIPLTVASVAFAGATYIAVEIPQIVELPVICKKTFEPDLKRGTLYIRASEGRPKTRQVETAEDMREVLEIASESLARSLITRAERAGFEAPERQSSAQQYTAQLGALNEA